MWLCACMRYWPGRGLVYAVCTIFKVIFANAIELSSIYFSSIIVFHDISKQNQQRARIGKIFARWHLVIAMTSCVRGTRTQPLISVGYCAHYWVSCAINKGGVFEIAFVSTHICLALRRLPHFDALTHMVICVSSAFIFQTFSEVCCSVFAS